MLQLRGNDLLVRNIDVLRACINKVKQQHPFIIHAWVVLPDHFQCVIELPEGGANFTLRLRLIKIDFSKELPKTEFCSEVRIRHIFA